MVKNNNVEIIIFILMAVIAGCSGNNGGKKNEPMQAKSEIVFRKPPSSFQDTMVITGRSVVFFSPDSKQLAVFRDVNSEMVYKSTTHDCLYLERNTRKVLEEHWESLAIHETENSRFLLFKKKDHSAVLIDLDPMDLCGLYLFDGENDPVQADMMNIETGLGEYFKK